MMIWLIAGVIAPLLLGMLVCMVTEIIDDRRLMKKIPENDYVSNKVKELELLLTMDILVIMSIKREIRESPIKPDHELIIDLDRWKEQYRDHYMEYEDLIG